MGKLKACPFCGSGDLSETSRYVLCNDCAAQGPRAMHGQGEQWNRRAGETCRIIVTEFDDSALQYILDLSCGHTVYYDEMRGPNFCPECGALVVRGRR